MKRHDPGLDPELEALLKPRNIVRHAPPDVRARALARARASLAAGGDIAPAPLSDPVAAPSLPVGRGRRVFRIALAASIAIAAGAAGAVAALRARAPQAPQTVLPTSPHAASAVPAERRPEPSGESPTAAPQPAPAARPGRPARVAGDPDPFTAELELLQRAHAGYTRRDFSGALTLIAEHARRFPRGHLAEQREALRVRSLAGSGRSEEAHRAAVAFAARFPRSVLLPSVENSGP